MTLKTSRGTSFREAHTMDVDKAPFSSRLYLLKDFMDANYVILIPRCCTRRLKKKILQLLGRSYCLAVSITVKPDAQLVTLVRTPKTMMTNMNHICQKTHTHPHEVCTLSV